jgi:futalosine hydrolase
VGLTATAFQLGSALQAERYDLAINAGLGGALDPELQLAQVVRVVSERFADLGVEEADGSFTSAQELGLLAADAPPFRTGRLWDDSAEQNRLLQHVHGISVNRVHGYAPSIAALRERYPDAQLESMEGAAFFYACLHSQQPMLQLRSISNYVTPRDRSAWQIGPAIEALNTHLWELIQAFDRADNYL